MITVTQVGKLSVAASDGKHRILSDIEKEKGGNEEGLTPHELIESALAACTAQTLELYAGRKNWDLTNLKVDVSITRVEKGETDISVKLTFGEQNTQEQRERLMEISKKCPIHKLLSGQIRIESSQNF